MNKNKGQAELVAIFGTMIAALLVGFGILWLISHHQKSFGSGDAVGPLYSSATNSNVKCGQGPAAGTFTIGPTSSTVSTATTTTPFTITINGTSVTSTAAATATANGIANALLPLIPTSTLNISAATTTDGTSVLINVTSTGAYGASTTLSALTPQVGITFSTSVTYPSTQVVAGAASRLYFSATNDSGNNIYLCKAAACYLNTGVRLNSAGGSYEQKVNDLYVGAYSCIGATTSSLLNVMYNQ